MEERKIQSAMEYLMSYGWAILIIAVALGALFSLGFFNSASLAPKVGPGSCQIYRPGGPGSTSFINIEGTCNNELPQYASQFNGNADINISSSSSLSPSSQITLSAWVYVNTYNPSGDNGIVAKDQQGTPQGPYYLQLANGRVSFFVANTPGNSGFTATVPTAVNLDTWYFVTGTYDGSNVVVYQNGQKMATAPCAASCAMLINGATVHIGQEKVATGRFFNGFISNVQIYNASLSANEIQALYQEGIGGVPININNLVGWWPLNGNANDYSGNLNNGVPTSVIYTSSWTSGYTPP